MFSSISTEFKMIYEFFFNFQKFVVSLSCIEVLEKCIFPIWTDAYELLVKQCQINHMHQTIRPLFYNNHATFIFHCLQNHFVLTNINYLLLLLSTLPLLYYYIFHTTLMFLKMFLFLKLQII